MRTLYYCMNCKRAFKEEKCPYCSSESKKELTINAPINILGTKLKGRILKIEGENVRVMHINSESHEKYIKTYPVEKIKKVL